MGVYSSIKCGFCGESWRLFSFGAQAPFGPPNVKCNACKNINSTEKQWYCTSSKLDKITIIVLMCWVYILTLIIGIGMIIIPFFNFETDSQKSSAPFAFLFGLVLLGYSIYRLTKIKKSLKFENEWVNKYKINGGYLTQDEYISMYG